VIDQEVFDLITPIFRSVMSDPSIELTPTTTTGEIPKWNSFRYVDIIMQIEESLDIRLFSREIDKLRNVGEMVELIKSKKAAG